MQSANDTVERRSTACRMVFTAEATSVGRSPGTFHVGVPLLGGPVEDVILADAGRPVLINGCSVFERDTQLAGFWAADPAAPLETSAREAYQRLLDLTGDYHLYRIWNFVPRINCVDADLENYRLFCRGRSLAFEGFHGSAFHRHLPAASAVGIESGGLALAFVAGREKPAHFENPAQVPAFEYPTQYGPRPPSFARATAVDLATERRIYISGTAAIREHRTVGAGDLDQQISCTLENLKLIGAKAGAGPQLGANGWRRSFKVYLRRQSDLNTARQRLNRELLQPTDLVQFLRADICRADLLIEIEATLTAPVRRG